MSIRLENFIQSCFSPAADARRAGCLVTLHSGQSKRQGSRCFKFGSHQGLKKKTTLLISKSFPVDYHQIGSSTTFVHNILYLIIGLFCANFSATQELLCQIHISKHNYFVPPAKTKRLSFDLVHTLSWPLKSIKIHFIEWSIFPQELSLSCFIFHSDQVDMIFCQISN